MHHTYVHRSHVYQDRYMHHTCMYHDQICFSFINHTCMYHNQGCPLSARFEVAWNWKGYFRLLESPCSSVRPFVRNKICRIIHTCGIVKDRGSQMHHTLMHHAHIRIKNICIIHTCIRVKEEHRYMHHTCMYQDQASWIKASYICAS